MNALILAAGRGERMRPLTDTWPKPLLRVGGRALIDYHLDALAAAGCARVIINTAWQGWRLHEHVAARAAGGPEIRFSDEGTEALETGGGIVRALPLLGPAPFLVVNGDIHTDYPFARAALAHGDLAHLVLVDNPPHHPGGDFTLVDGRVARAGERALTFAGIGVYHPGLFADLAATPQPLAPLLTPAIESGQVSGEHYDGAWCDVGTPTRLRALDARLAGTA